MRIERSRGAAIASVIGQLSIEVAIVSQCFSIGNKKIKRNAVIVDNERILPVLSY